MNKKLLIASLFATIMLLVPMTSVVGVSDVEEDCGCRVISSLNLVIVKRLLARLEVYINIILLRFGYIPEVTEKCNELLDIVYSIIQLDYPIICAIVILMWYQALFIKEIVDYLLPKFEDNPIMEFILWAIPTFLGLTAIRLADDFDCELPMP